MGKGTLRSHRKARENFDQLTSHLLAQSFTVSFMGKTGIVEHKFDDYSDAKQFAHNVNSAGVLITPNY